MLSVFTLVDLFVIRPFSAGPGGSRRSGRFWADHGRSALSELCLSPLLARPQVGVLLGFVGDLALMWF
jgi:hypothetical protein